MAGGRRPAKAPRTEDPPAAAAVAMDAEAAPATAPHAVAPALATIMPAPSAAAAAASRGVTFTPWLEEFWSGGVGALDAPAAAACECGTLEVGWSGGKSAATRVFSRYPLRLLVPKLVAAPGVDAVWCYSVTFGGGLVAGDRSGMSVTVEEGCTLALATQGTTKVYKHNGRAPPPQTAAISSGPSSSSAPSSSSSSCPSG
mmetsp:Transcript_17681/g.43720  ORF Transcript_17681/g.43720 Transcript_17681/m.43720 type:complete len:200 (+) Transcript_17681:33-632(+)